MAIDEFNLTPFGNGFPHWYLGTATPSAGTYYAGDIIFNSTPTASGPAFWLCVTGGSTGGTWVPRSGSASGFAVSAASPSDASITWAAGDVVFNSAPAATGPIGWIATTAGAGSAANFLAFGQINPTLPLT